MTDNIFEDKELNMESIWTESFGIREVERLEVFIYFQLKGKEQAN